ncbi:MAG: CusA/CzcA family heavy metal efflux RND transporter [Cyclobacteriaceae bacterium]|nr:CusA/CzcA family heavy metal efflux RND transporter [Cyclobacteriaceae bacterium]
MIEGIIAFSIRNKLIVLLFVTGLIGWGIYSITQIPLGTVPDITNNQVQVITTSRNLATEDIEQFITFPIELEMGNLPGVKEIRSISKFGLSVVTIIFDDGMGTYLPRQLIAEKLQTIQATIPAEYGTPEMGPISTGLGEIYQYILDVEPGYDTVYSTMELRTIQDWIVRRQLIGIHGVVEVNTWGGFLKQYEVAVDPGKLAAIDITIGEVFKALEGNNANIGGGYIEKYQESYFVRGEGMIKTISDIENVVVKNTSHMPVLVRDIGTVKLGYATRFGAITANGQGEKVLGQIMMLKGADSGKVIKEVKRRVAEVQATLPPGIVINPFLERTELINKTTFTISENLVLGALIVIFVVVILLGDWRSGLIVSSIIPLCLLVSISFMNVFGISANLMSLGAIDFGIIIDGAVIIVEYVLYQFTSQQASLARLTGKERQDAKDNITRQAANKMMNSAFFGQIIILIVFIPILSLTDIEGKMFRPMALAFSFAIIGALFLCLTYVPAMAALILRPESHEKPGWGDRIMAFLDKLYVPSLSFALDHRKLVIGLALLLLGSGVFIYSQMGGEFVPTLDEGDYVVQPILTPGTSLAETVEFCTNIEKILLDNFPEVTQVVSRIGAAEVPTDPMSMEMSDIIIKLKPKNEWVSADTKEALADKMKEAMSVFPGVEFEFTQPIEMRFNELITGVRADVAVKIYGEDLNILYDQAAKIKSLISDVKGAADISVEQIVGLPQMNVTYNRARLAHYGLNVADVNDLVQTAFAGRAASTIFEGERRFDLVVRFDQKHRASLEDLKGILVTTPTGQRIPITEVADISTKRWPAQISRDDTRRRIVIGINVRNRDVETIVEEVQQIVDDHIDLPDGYFISYGGQFENLQNASKRLKVVVPLALALIFILLYFVFESITQAIIIFTAIPLAAIGGVYLLWLRDMPFSISAGVGFVALFGIATLNGIVLISHFNELKELGIDNIRQRIIDGTRARLRPVILTASAAALGFFPMAFSSSAGAEVQKPLATVVIGGLFTATLLTLIVLPVIYMVFYSRKGKGRMANFGLKTVIILVSASLMSISGKAQQPTISLDEALEMALANNMEIKNAALNIEHRKALVKTGWTLGETEFNYMNGQINSEVIDYNWALKQDLGMPFHQASAAAYLKQLLKQSEAEQALLMQKISMETNLRYYELAWRQQRYDLIKKDFAQYEEAVNIAKLKYESGESNLLSKVMMDAQYENLRLMLQQAEVDNLASRQKLMQILLTDQPFAAALDSLPKVALQLEADSVLEMVQKSSLINFLNVGLKASAYNVKVQRSTISPRLGVGYFNQSIDRMQGLDGWEVNVKFPLWFRGNSGQIQAAKLQHQMAANVVEQRGFELASELKVLNTRRRTLADKLLTYERNMLKNASLIIENAGLLYRNGEIEYLEYIRSISQAIDIKLNYLDNLNELNQLTIQMNYLIK